MPVESPSLAAANLRCIFLDRDGVINRKLPEGEYVARPEQLELLPGAAAAIAGWNRSGRTVVVVTNQRGVALGRMSEGDLQAVHDRLRAELALDGARLDAIYYCPHHRDACQCRKPRTGMIEAAFRDFPGAAPENSVLVGDSLSDIECGRAVGMRTILVTGNTEAGNSAAALIANAVVSSLAEAALLLG